MCCLCSEIQLDLCVFIGLLDTLAGIVLTQGCKVMVKSSTSELSWNIFQFYQLWKTLWLFPVQLLIVLDIVPVDTEVKF